MICLFVVKQLFMYLTIEAEDGRYFKKSPMDERQLCRKPPPIGAYELILFIFYFYLILLNLNQISNTISFV